MKYDSKQYLYNKLLEYNIGDETIHTLLKIFGDNFYIRPGSLDYYEVDVNTPGIKCNNFSFENHDLICYEIDIIGYYTKVKIIGQFGALPVRITLYSIISKEKINFDLTIIDREEKGVYLFDSNVIIGYSDNRPANIYYYDLEAYKCLRDNYNYSDKQLLKLDEKAISKLGIEPDEIINPTFAELKVHSSIELLHNILTTMKSSELLDLFQEVSDNHSKEKEKTKVKHRLQ